MSDRIIVEYREPAIRTRELEIVDKAGEITIRLAPGSTGAVIAAPAARSLAAWLSERYPAPDPEPPTPAREELTPGTVVRVVGDEPRNCLFAVSRGRDLSGRAGVVTHVQTCGCYTVKFRGGRINSLAPEFVEPVDTATLTPGTEAQLLPDATTAAGGRVYFSDEVTRVRVESGPEGLTGDYRVRSIDGPEKAGWLAHGRGAAQYVAARFLVPDPAPEPTPEPEPFAPGTPVVIGADAMDCYGSDLFVPTGLAGVVLKGPETSSCRRCVLVEARGEGRLNVHPGYLSRVEPREWAPGTVAQLLPGAKTARGHEVYFADGVTRVGVEFGPDEDGDYQVRALDGPEGRDDDMTYAGRGDTQYVSPAYLVPLPRES